jgi:hypothetical protein
MKISLLLNESVNLLRYRNFVEQAVVNSIRDTIDYIPTLLTRLPPKMVYSAKNGNAEELLRHLAPQLRKTGYNMASHNLKKYINTNMPEVENKVNIIFKDIKSDARVEGTNVQIKSYYLDYIIRTILSTLKHHLNSEKTQDKLSILRNMNGQEMLDSYNFEEIHTIRDMVDACVHELVHVVQNLNQKHRNGTTEYRSYLTRDQKKFEEVLDDIENHPEAYLYYASPQEIAAFAHDLASLIIKKLHKKEDVSSKTIQDTIQDFFGDIFKNVKHKKLQKVINRYYKLVYKEVMNYFGEL